MKIGIDIDDVLVDFIGPLLSVFEKKFGRRFEFENASSSKPWECFDISEEDARGVVIGFNDMEEFDLPAIGGAKRSLEHLKANHEIVSITARQEGIREKTEEFLYNKFGVGIRVFCGNDFWKENGDKSKLNICKELGVDVLIDDNEKFSKEVAESGVKVLLFDRPWNKNIEHENIVRVGSWKEILEEIKKMENEDGST